MSLTRRDSRPESSIPDEDVSDLVSGGLYLREWVIVGTPPPSPSSDTVEHLVLNYRQVAECAGESGTRRIIPRPMVLDHESSYQVEEIPIRKETLGEYTEYFSTCVAPTKSDLILNICKVGRRAPWKSPCIDIPRCLVIKPGRDISEISSDYCKARIGDQDYILMMPQSVIDGIMESVSCVGEYVVSVSHDAWPYNSSRLKMSQIYTDFAPRDSDWDSTSSYIKDLRKYVSCSAVCTATLTVTFVLSLCWGKYSYHKYRKSLSIVIHAVK